MQRHAFAEIHLRGQSQNFPGQRPGQRDGPALFAAAPPKGHHQAFMIDVHIGIQGQHLMQFGSGMPDEQKNKKYALAGRGDVRPFGRAGPAAEFLFQLVQLQRVQTVV